MKRRNSFIDKEEIEQKSLEENQIELWRKLGKNKPRILRKVKLEKIIKSRIENDKNINKRLFYWVTTLDVDTTNKEFIEKIWKKIINCEYNKQLEITPSSLKGTHFIIRCTIDCIICRMVYDDTRRLAYDMNRPYYARNILFNKKERVNVKDILATEPKNDIEIKS